MSGYDDAGLIDRLPKARVLVVGDVMLDCYVYGSVDRVSPEAPVPVLRVERRDVMLGGAGNVAQNLEALLARTVLVAVTGRDSSGSRISRLLEETNVTADLIVDGARPTTIKTRYVAGPQQLLRVDDEESRPLPPALQARLRNAARAAVADCRAVLLSDYAKGVFLGDSGARDGVLGGVLAAARNRQVPVIVDPKGSDFGRYRGATVLTPNRAELAAASGMPVDGDAAVEAAARHVAATCGIGAVLVTRGPEGASVVTADDGAVAHLRPSPREVFDVSGAGDTFAAVVAAAMAVGAGPAQAARLANVAAGLVVGRVGTAAVGLEDLRAAVLQIEPAAGGGRILGAGELMEQLGRWRARGLRVGFANGCFDVLHAGHVALLQQAGAACDRLVVGLNSDASVARLKGPGRPVRSAGARATLLAHQQAVDAVVTFDDDTPLALIDAIRPDVLAKGGDYTEETVVGADIVRHYGGRVLVVELVAGESTTTLVEQLTRRSG